MDLRGILVVLLVGLAAYYFYSPETFSEGKQKPAPPPENHPEHPWQGSSRICSGHPYCHLLASGIGPGPAGVCSWCARQRHRQSQIPVVASSTCSDSTVGQKSCKNTCPHRRTRSDGRMRRVIGIQQRLVWVWGADTEPSILSGLATTPDLFLCPKQSRKKGSAEDREAVDTLTSALGTHRHPQGRAEQRLLPTPVGEIGMGKQTLGFVTLGCCSKRRWGSSSPVTGRHTGRNPELLLQGLQKETPPENLPLCPQNWCGASASW